MSKRGLEQVLMRTLGDAEFRDQLRTSPDTALGRFDLTDAEREAILAGNATELLDFGVDKRLVQLLPPDIYRLGARLSPPRTRAPSWPPYGRRSSRCTPRCTSSPSKLTTYGEPGMACPAGSAG